MDYKKILKGVVDIINTTERSDIGFTNICSYIGENCPELQNEDEKTRQKLISHFKNLLVESSKQECNDFLNKEFKEYIAWLEKQDTQTPHKYNTGNWIISKYGGIFQIKEVKTCYISKVPVEITEMPLEDWEWEVIRNGIYN